LSGRLSGKTAIITGAGQGIGAAIARSFVAEGARVVIAEVNEQAGAQTAAELSAASGQAVFIPVDVADSDSVTAMVNRAIELLGPPNVLVNNAGINVFNDPLKLTDEEWRRCFSVDLEGVWRCTRAVLPHLLAQGKGDVLNIASIHGIQIIPGCFPYPAAKSGLLGLTSALAIEYAAKNIRFNAISPGYIETLNVKAYFETFPDADAERQRVNALMPVQRIGTPEEIAAAAVFVASDECRFMTGLNMVIDGGRHVLYHDVPGY
jgi:NAD(P)-dependent dehydrogenase (short-subunit alcohol dehydrogenase family)